METIDEGPPTQSEKDCDRIKTKFFDTLFNDKRTRPLAEYDREHGRVLYAKCKGTKTTLKNRILNNAMRIYCGTILHRVTDGKPAQPNGVMVKLKILFAEFRRHGIEFRLGNDFNYYGGFSNALAKFWNSVKMSDGDIGETFAKRPTVGTLPSNYSEILQERVVERGLVDFSGNNVTHLQWLMSMGLCTQLLFRGRKELYELKWSDLRLGQYPKSDKNFPGLEFLEVLGSAEHKTKKVGVNRATLYAEHDTRRIVDNPNDPISLVKIYKIYRGICHPDQRYVFCKRASQRLKHQFKVSRMPYLVDADFRVGVNVIGTFSKNLHKQCELGDDIIDKNCTNHSWRAYGITRLSNDHGVNNMMVMNHARHNNPTSQMPYVRTSHDGEKNLQRAIQHVQMPSVRELKRINSGAGKHGNKVVAKKKAAPLKKPFKKASQVKVTPGTRKSNRIQARKENGKKG